MLRETFERQMQRLMDDMLILGSIVEKAILEAVEALRVRDVEASRRIIAADRQVNEKRYAIEEGVLVLIATQQPMARDLRTLAAMLEIATELERMGDYAKGISRISLMIGSEPLIKPLLDIPRMAEKACDMLHRALGAFARQDVAVARAIPKEDDEVDALYNQVYRELMTFIISDPAVLERANYLLWVAHNLERAADRVTNICERVVFTATGQLGDMDAEAENRTLQPR
jgi:phosphate transport system protein